MNEKSKNKRICKMLTKDVDFSGKRKFCRSSLILYNIVDGGRKFLFCVDSKFGDLTDPGGGLGESENFIVGAVRELKEETLNIFDVTNDIEFIKNNSVCIYDNNSIIIFQEIDTEDLTIFCEKYNDVFSTESGVFT